MSARSFASKHHLLPRTGLIFYAKAPVMVDSIGLSAAALWAALPTTHRSIYLVDENTLRSAETIIANIEASDYLNDGGELTGSVTKGYAQYEDGTSEAVLRRAYRYFGLGYTWVDLIPSLSILPTTWDYGTIDGGNTSDKTFVLTNSGNEVAEDIEVAVSGDGFSLISSAGPFDIAVDGTANIQVRFSPVAPSGAKTGTITISWPNRDDIIVDLDAESGQLGVWVTDNFNRADSSTLGSNWTLQTGTSEIMGIESNQAKGTTTAAFWTGNDFDNNQASQVKLVGVVTLTRLVVRGSPTGWTCYYLRIFGTDLGIYRRDAQYTSVLLGYSSAFTQSAGDTVALVADGTTIKAYHNGTLKCSFTDSTYSSGRPGFEVLGTNVYVEDFAGGDLSAMP